MPRTATIIAAAVAGLAVASWYGQRHAARITYKAFLLGRATEQERQTHADDNPAPAS